MALLSDQFQCVSVELFIFGQFADARIQVVALFHLRFDLFGQLVIDRLTFFYLSISQFIVIILIFQVKICDNFDFKGQNL